MDKLRAIEYFVAAAEERSLSGAARRHEVSIPAVAKLVSSLERELGARLFERSPQGLVVTTDGERYLESCRPLLADIARADDAVRAGAARPKGTVVVAGPAFVLQNLVGPSLLRFHERYPDIELDFRIANAATDPDAAGADVLVLFGWHETPDFVQKTVAHNRYVVLATPAYWRAHGVPKRPKDLEQHQCFSFRNPRRVLLDLWEFQRGGEKESVQARGWLASSHRNMLLDAALAGAGVVRSTDLIAQGLVRSGHLRAALEDWEALHPPPAHVLFRPQSRRTPRVRAFVDHVADTFRRLEAGRTEQVVTPAERPAWYGTRYGRLSATGRG